MKKDVLQWAAGQRVTKLIRKETLNHTDLIEKISGLDVYKDTQEAYLKAYEHLGIDIINRVPLENAPPPTPAGQTKMHPTLPYQVAPLGVYDTVMRHTYACKSVEQVWTLEMDQICYQDLMTPVPHSCKPDDIALRDQAIGDIGLYYPMLYTTLFMWPVEVLGWEIFMLAAISEPERFHDHFLIPCIKKSKKIIADMLKGSESPFLFLHDDLASHTGPMFPPSWYDEYIFPHYRDIWAKAKEQGRKIIFVADGNMSHFLPKLVQAGVDGIMFENPATPVESVIEHFGNAGQFMIGGVNTRILTTGSPSDVRQMLNDLMQKVRDVPGFAIASCGGLHENIPIENLEAYFEMH
ncbi:hypothetical protein GF406_22670 [candidate division KSB1 bacterium]|nr:hypothetical protein [candidate division KSB1 bacterium]